MTEFDTDGGRRLEPPPDLGAAEAAGARRAIWAVLGALAFGVAIVILWTSLPAS